MVIDKAEVKIIYVCTEGRPWVKTANGYERVTYEEEDTAAGCSASRQSSTLSRTYSANTSRAWSSVRHRLSCWRVSPTSCSAL